MGNYKKLVIETNELVVAEVEAEVVVELVAELVAEVVAHHRDSPMMGTPP